MAVKILIDWLINQLIKNGPFSPSMPMCPAREGDLVLLSSFKSKLHSTMLVCLTLLTESRWKVGSWPIRCLCHTHWPGLWCQTDRQTAGYKVTALSCVFAAFKPGFLTKTGQKSQRRTAVQLFFLDSIPIMLIWSVTLLGSRSPLKHS